MVGAGCAKVSAKMKGKKKFVAFGFCFIGMQVFKHFGLADQFEYHLTLSLREIPDIPIISDIENKFYGKIAKNICEKAGVDDKGGNVTLCSPAEDYQELKYGSSKSSSKSKP